ncbi:MAG TPA: xylulose 5-phosphate 3-epimerase [Candidatus Polarisedimenticolia bacterium]|nr:xylulose 5-phosphate 3-epimerase [Candidatus Polarisedimenticolia bacterium]
MREPDEAELVRIREQAELHRRGDESFARWAAGCGPIRHAELTQVRMRAMADLLSARGVKGDGAPFFDVLHAADRVACAAMWLVVHETYARTVHTDGRRLRQEDFKEHPEGHTGGSLNMVPAYTGYMAYDALTGRTRSWLMGQGHCVSAVDSVNLILGNLTPAHASRYDLTGQGLTRYVRDFYSLALREDGRQDSPLGSHVNAHTAGGLIEGGYLGFAELQYVHMPLPGENLVVFLSDGAFEEQRGSDWAPRWWRAEDCGLVAPIMIHNGRRIDQRTTMSQEGGVSWFVRHLELNGFDPLPFDGRDPAAFIWALFEIEERLSAAAAAIADGRSRYPVRLPYGIAGAPKGAGFYGEGTNLAHNLPLPGNPRHDEKSAALFNEHARRLWIPPDELEAARDRMRRHGASGRPLERDHPLATREAGHVSLPAPPAHPVPGVRSPRGPWGRASAMSAVDETYLAAVRANPRLRPRVGNPDEMRSNRMVRTLEALKFRVTDPEPGIPESVHGAVVTALNEEAVASAALGNKGGINIIVSYEAFAAKMHGVIRQEIIFSAHAQDAGRAPGWLSVPLVLTSHTWENAKNEQSHQDPSLCEALLGETGHVSRVLFPPDANTAGRTLTEAYRTHGQIWTMVVPKAPGVAVVFTPAEAEAMVRDGAMALEWCGAGRGPARLSLLAVGAYQLAEALMASARLTERGVAHRVGCLLEPGRFRRARSGAEARHAASAKTAAALVPAGSEACVVLSHTRPETMAGTLEPLLAGRRAAVLGYLNQGGTLDTRRLLFVNRSSWAHALEAAARLLELDRTILLAGPEIAALEGRGLLPPTPWGEA